MKPTSAIHAVYACVLLASSCSAPNNDGVYGDPGSFAAINKSRISNDCVQNQMCLESPSHNMTLPADWLDSCIASSASMLNSMPEKQPNFLEATSRCGKFTICDYYDCTNRHASGYGQAQMDKVNYECQQRVQCAIDQGHGPPDPNEANANCVGDELGMLFNYSIEQRTNYESTFASCGQLASCAFVGCFPF